MNLPSIQSQLAYNGASIRSLHESIAFLRYMIKIEKERFNHLKLELTKVNTQRYKQIMIKKKQIAKLVKLQKELKADIKNR